MRLPFFGKTQEKIITKSGDAGQFAYANSFLLTVMLAENRTLSIHPLCNTEINLSEGKSSGVTYGNQLYRVNYIIWNIKKLYIPYSMFLSLFGHPTAEQNDPKMLNISFVDQAR